MVINFNKGVEVKITEFTIDLQSKTLEVNGKVVELVNFVRNNFYFEAYIPNHWNINLEVNGSVMRKIVFSKDGLFLYNGTNCFPDSRYRKFKRNSKRNDWVLVIKNQPKQTWIPPNNR